jgi:hypothetical protein
MLAHAHDRIELAAVIVLKTLSFWVLILPPIKISELKSQYQFKPFKASLPILSRVR